VWSIAKWHNSLDVFEIIKEKLKERDQQTKENGMKDREKEKKRNKKIRK